MRNYTGAAALVAIFAVIVATCSGCASVAPTRLDACATHVSHPLRGWPTGPATEEDSLDTVGVCGEWEVGRVTIDQSLGYKYVDGGFNGDDFVYLGRFRFKLWERRD